MVTLDIEGRVLKTAQTSKGKLVTSLKIPPCLKL